MTSVIGGGQFGHGFVSAGLGEGLGGALGDWLVARGLSEATARTLEAALIGGTSTEATGGKFANGAASAALAHLSSNAGATRQQQAGNAGKGGFFEGVLDIAGKIWALPNTLVGLAYGGVGHVDGWVLGTNPYITFGNKAIQFYNNPLTRMLHEFASLRELEPCRQVF